MTTKAPLSSRGPRAWVWTLSITVSVYASCSTFRLAGGDSGELLAEACVGGNAHPPGYPLLLLVLRALRVLGSYVCPDVRFVILANHLNAVFAASAAACVTHVMEMLVGQEHMVEAVAAGLLYSFSALTWEYAIGLEVFALNNLLVGLLLVCFVGFYVGHQSMTTLYAGAFVCGLGLANQHTIVLFEIPMIMWIIATTKLRLLNWAYLTVAFAAGVSPYAYTYLAAQTPTIGSWGDASSLQGLMTHILRREYGTFQLSPKQGPSDTLFARFAFYASDAIDEFTPIGAICAVLGIVSSIAPTNDEKQPRVDPVRSHVVKVLVLTLAGYVAVFSSLANLPLNDPLAREVTRRFSMQPNMIIALMTGCGIVSLRRYMKKFHSLAGSQLVGGATIALVAHQILRNHSHFTSSPVARHDLLHDFGTSILRDLPANALLLSYTDVQWNAVRYLQTCEHTRTDVTHLNLQVMAFPWFERQHHLYPQVTFPPTLSDVSTNRSSQGYATYLSRFVRANLRDHQIFLDLHGVDEATITSEQLLFGQIQVLPHRFVWQVVQAGSSAERLVEQWRSFAIRRNPVVPPTNLLVDCCGIASHVEPLTIPRGSWEFVVVSIAHDAMYQQSLTKLGYHLAHGSVLSVEQLQEAVLAFDAIQHELNELVWAGTQFVGGAITYDLYAVEKNAVVSRQRFQLYLEVLADLIQQGHDVKLSNSRIEELLKERKPRQEKAIAQVERFLVMMERERDGDTNAIRNGLETLKSKRNSAQKTAPATQRAAKDASHKRKKRRKQTP